jgi:hypothetical protein
LIAPQDCIQHHATKVQNKHHWAERNEDLISVDLQFQTWVAYPQIPEEERKKETLNFESGDSD